MSIQKIGWMDSWGLKIFLGLVVGSMVLVCLFVFDKFEDFVGQMWVIFVVFDDLLVQMGSGCSQLMMVYVWLVDMVFWLDFVLLWNDWIGFGFVLGLLVVQFVVLCCDVLVEICIWVVRVGDQVVLF